MKFSELRCAEGSSLCIFFDFGVGFRGVRRKGKDEKREKGEEGSVYNLYAHSSK